MKLGVEVKINVKQINKALLYEGEKGTYLTLTTFIDTESKDQYGNNGGVTQAAPDKDTRMDFIGNSKIFWKGGQGKQASTDEPQGDSIPF